MPDAIVDVALGEHGDARDRDRTELQTGGERDLPFGDPGQHHDHPIALHDAARREPVRNPVARARHVVEREPALVAAGVTPDEGELRWVARPGIYDIGAEVEHGGGLELVPGDRALVVVHAVGGHLRMTRLWRTRGEHT